MAADAQTAKSENPTKTTPARWTDEQVQLLRDAVAGSATNSAAFREVAEKLGKSEGTVSQKWHNLNKGSAPTKKKSGSRSSGPVSIKYDVTRIPFETLSREDLDLLMGKADEELTRREVADEVAAKRVELEEALAKELAKFEAEAIKKAMKEAEASA